MMRLFILLVLYIFPLSAIAQGNSLLWRINGKGLVKTSYLYGTMHTTDSRVFHFADSVIPCLEICDAFAMEVVMDETTQATIMQNVFMENGNTLNTYLSDEEYDSLDRFSREHTGMGIGIFDRMKPLYVAMMLEMISLDESFPGNPDPFLDQYLERSAREQQKKVAGLETVEEQMRLFDVMTYPDQARLLMRAIREYSDDTSEFATMVQHYLDNDLYHMMQFENDFSLPEELYEVLITDRNITMARRIDSMIQSQSYFIAVGAGHLGDKGGLVELLRDKGYTVVPVIPSFNNYLADGWYQFSSLKNNFTCSFPSQPKIETEATGSLTMAYYSSKIQLSSVTEESFSLMVISSNQSKAEIRQMISEKGLTIRHFEETNDTINSFTYENSSRMEGTGWVSYSRNKTFILLYSSKNKPKNQERFFNSFRILNQ